MIVFPLCCFAVFGKLRRSVKFFFHSLHGADERDVAGRGFTSWLGKTAATELTRRRNELPNCQDIAESHQPFRCSAVFVHLEYGDPSLRTLAGLREVLGAVSLLKTRTYLVEALGMMTGSLC